MPDAALLDLMTHMSWQPPALIGPAPAAMGGGLAERVYETFLARSEAEAAAWKERGVKVRQEVWGIITSGEGWPSVDAMSGMIDEFEKNLRREGRILHQLRRKIAREASEAPESRKAAVRRLNGKLLAIAETFHEEGKDFALFLRAFRAEIDPNARGGPEFDNADDLEEYLNSALA